MSFASPSYGDTRVEKNTIVSIYAKLLEMLKLINIGFCGDFICLLNLSFFKRQYGNSHPNNDNS